MRRSLVRLSPLEVLVEGVVGGDRASLSRAVTLVESSLREDVARADELLAHVARRAHARAGLSFRVGIVGPPGCGKSTFVEALGIQLLGAGHKVAVVAVDPSSQLRGGSILGDRTRMPRLANADNAFVRPTPARGHLGGVAAQTHAVLGLCEAAGHDVLLVESVGVGQSELAIDDVADAVVLLLPPAAGDELQACKAGVMEIADVIAVTKADGEMAAAAARAAADVRRALRLAPRRRYGDAWTTHVVECSALSDAASVASVWDAVLRFKSAVGGGSADAAGGGPAAALDGALRAKRARQLERAAWDLARLRLVADFDADVEARRFFDEDLRPELRTALATPRDAARRLLDFAKAPK
ncbi:ArgK protein-domain-containing protein [Pelagophyceae sp. CCMP2097]|nr:ArgK protein-domain-containing protein [Pelagophyceae sp. CCMP2097]